MSTCNKWSPTVLHNSGLDVCWAIHTHMLPVVQAINIMSLGVDFEITQVVDSNVGIHSKIPK